MTLFLLVAMTGQSKGKGEFTVLQWNVWQEGTMVPGGYDAIVNEIVRLQPDFVTFSEVRNYHNTRFNERIVASLKEKGLDYYSFYTYDTGLLSKHPITDSLTVFPENGDHGSIYRLTSSVNGHKVAVYTSHLDYLDCAYYNVRGYDGSSWKEIPIPTTVEEVLKVNVASQRDDAIKMFIAQAQKDIANGYSVIIGGDFNEPSWLDWTEGALSAGLASYVVQWPTTRSLWEGGIKGDAYRTIHPDPVTHPGFTWTPRPSEKDTKDRLDLTLYTLSPNTDVKSCQVIGENTETSDIVLPNWGPFEEVFDHRGLRTEFVFTK